MPSREIIGLDDLGTSLVEQGAPAVDEIELKVDPTSIEPTVQTAINETLLGQNTVASPATSASKPVSPFQASRQTAVQAAIASVEHGSNIMTSPRRNKWRLAVGLIGLLSTSFMATSGIVHATNETRPAVNLDVPLKGASSPPTSKLTIGASQKAIAPNILGNAATIPDFLLNCSKTLLRFTVSASAKIDVIAQTKNGTKSSTSLIVFSDGSHPRATMYGLVGVGACQSPGTAAPKVVGDTVTIDRGTIGFQEAFAKIGKGMTETVQGFKTTTAMPNVTNAALINSELVPNGALHDAYGQTVDWALKDATLQQMSLSNQTEITAITDKEIVAQINALNSKRELKVQYVFTGDYPSFASKYEQANRKPNTVTNVSLEPFKAATVLLKNVGK